MDTSDYNGKIGYYSSTNFSPNDILYMLKDLPDACCIFKVLTDPFGTVKDMLFLFANEKYAQMVGKSSAELVGSTFFTTVKNRDEDWIKYSYQAAILRQSTIDRSYNSTFDKWFEFWAVPVYQKGFCAFIIHDVTAAKRNEENTALATNTNELIIECATAVSSAEFGKGLRKVLKLLGQTIEADRVFVVEKQEKGAKAALAFSEWVNPARSVELPTRKVFDKYDIIGMWDRQLNGKNVLVVNDSSVLLNTDEELYNSVLAGSVYRYIVVLLKDKQNVLGYLVADNYANDLSLNVVDAMESVAIFIAAEMRNKILTDEMMFMGSHDALTGLGNRYSLNQALVDLSGLNECVGVCYSDINGLKAINDEMGHEEGDKLIKDAAAAFSAIFKKKYCYRIGGDEFIAIVPEIDEASFKELLAKLKTKTKKISLSFGSVWIEDSKDIRAAVREADEAMYESKAKYYASHERRHKT
jgi:diguanylate cyclase (GGDEF)-like protein/PAS domain S-box-containing protein